MTSGNLKNEIQDTVDTMEICRVCLAVSVKMYHMSEHKLSVMYEHVTGVEMITEDKLPKMLCWECVARLSSASKFKEKALKTQWILKNKINSSRVVTISDIESIDRAQYQLESKLGSNIYKENDADLYIFAESDKTNDPFNIANLCKVNDMEISNEGEQILSTDLNVIDEIDRVKEEHLEDSEERNVSDEEYKEGDISHEKDEINNQNKKNILQAFEIANIEIKSDSAIEMGIENMSNISVKSDEENIVAETEVCEEMKQSPKAPPMNWSEALPHCKELGVVVEDMVTFNKHNTQDSHEKFTAQVSQVAVSPTAHHPQIKEESSENLTKNVASGSSGSVEDDISVLPDDKRILTRHIKRHPTRHSCTYCSYKAYKKHEVKRHINCMHTKNISFNCSFCSYTTDNKSNFTKHVNAKHTKTDVYNCSLCDYSAYAKGSLTRHINVKHTQTHVYNCSFCSYKTYDKCCLPRHIRIKHTKTNVYNCSLCSYKAYDKSILTRHVNVKHTKINVFNCSLCSYKAYDKGSLTKHINVKHTKTDVYNCTLCSYKAYEKGSLTRHINVKHTKTNVYNCSFCSYKTYDKRCLTKHVKTHQKQAITGNNCDVMI